MKTPEMIAADEEVHANRLYFDKMKPEWEKEHSDQHVLLHHQNLVAFFYNKQDALNTGYRDYGLGNFSVQSVTEPYICLGGYDLGLVPHKV